VPRTAILTPTALERVAKMVKQGATAAEIADEIGCTLGTLRVRCSQSRISLRHPGFKRVGGNRADYHEGREAGSTNCPPRRRLNLSLPQQTMIQLDEWAAVHGLSAASLAAKLLVTIGRDSLFAAVLDESVEANPFPLQDAHE
jgi:hypothetical protein